MLQKLGNKKKRCVSAKNYTVVGLGFIFSSMAAQRHRPPRGGAGCESGRCPQQLCFRTARHIKHIEAYQSISKHITPVLIVSTLLDDSTCASGQEEARRLEGK